MNDLQSQQNQRVAALGSSRILAPDLARGMMLLFIAVANVSIYLWGRNVVGISTHPSGEGPFDTALSAFVILFIDGHVYPMFAFLFGYGITQFATSRIARGVPQQSVTRMLLRRHIWLLVFGAVHAILLFAGDVLGAYALTGLALVALLLHGNDRLIRILLYTFASICVGSMLLVAFGLVLLGMVIPAELVQTPSGVPGLEASLGGTADLMSGITNYWAAMAARFGLWLGSSIGAVLMLIVPLVVLFGGYAARYRWLEGTRLRFSLQAVATWGISIGVLGALPAALDYLGIWQLNILISLGASTFAQLCAVAGGLGYAALFALIGQRIGVAKSLAVRAIAAVGKRSLSFYLLQSLVFAPLLSAWGFGLGATISSSAAYALALFVWLASVAIAVWLERLGQRGPAEMLLRKLTYANDDVLR